MAKTVFIDDDIRVSVSRIVRLIEELDSNQVAAMVCREFPDNSVVCHARRLAGLPKGNSVTGAAMGINCSTAPLPYFLTFATRTGSLSPSCDTPSAGDGR
jgi:hypothetical protein